MKRLRIDLFSLLVLALLLAGAIVLWGDRIGLTTPEQRGVGLSLLAGGTLMLALFASFDRLGRWSDALRALRARLHLRRPEMVGTTQINLLVPSSSTSSPRHAFDALCSDLRQRHGRRWRYRQPWLLLTGNDKTIARLLPELAEHGYLITDDAVLLWRASDANGHPDETWLSQLYRLRRRRPVDGLVLVINGIEDKLSAARGLARKD